MATSRRLFRNNLCEKREGERKKTPDHEKEVDEKDVNTDANTNTKTEPGNEEEVNEKDGCSNKVENNQDRDCTVL